MNQNIFKKFLVGLLAFNIFTTTAFSVQGNESKITYAQEEQNFTFIIQDQNGPIMTKDFTFEVVNEKGEIKKVQTKMSMLNLNLSNGNYTVKLKDDEYSMEEISFTVTDEGIDNYESIINFVLKKKENVEPEEPALEVPVTLMLTTQKENHKDFVLGNYEFEILDKETGKLVTTVTSDKSMLQLSLPDGTYTVKLKENKDYTMKDVKLDVYEDDNAYTIDDKDSVELDLVKIEVEPEPEKPVTPEEKGSNEVLVRVVFDGKPKANFKIALMEFDPIPNIIQQASTNENGEVKFSGFKSNVKYQLRLRSADKTMTFETEVFEFTTNEKGLITKINDKEVNSKEDAVVEFKGSNKDSNKFETFPVEFYARYKDGTPAKGVEFSINRLSPRLSSYRKVKSDENGKVVFNLEGEATKDGAFGRLYNITISKMEMFKHRSVPFGMDFTVDDKGKVTVISVERSIDDKVTDTSNPEVFNMTFTLEKDDRTQIYEDFKAIYEKAVNYLNNTKFEDGKEAEKAKKELENVIDASKVEIEETIPEYATKKIEELTTAMENLKKFELKNEEVKDSWKFVNDNWYRYDKDGNMIKDSWFEEDGKWYYLESNGTMSQNEWVLVNGNWYYANASGRISQNEWVLVNGNWYFANASGRIAANEWFMVDGKWYYAEGDGRIAQSKTLKIKNVNYTFDSNGVLVK
ncbi:N-acetylmuramoyl-L-alanine amidase family protein [Parvimonas sp. G1641]|uniref:N-acetylmuramoyl-L-alanine amidase family protein n=1 Tax=Parvimonas sp. G1641 TaxID=3388846 RepID=UPI00397F2EF4